MECSAWSPFFPFAACFTRPDQVLCRRIRRDGTVSAKDEPGTAVHIQQIEHKTPNLLPAAFMDQAARDLVEPADHACAGVKELLSFLNAQMGRMQGPVKDGRRIILVNIEIVYTPGKPADVGDII